MKKISRQSLGRAFRSHGPLVVFVSVFAVVGAIVLSHSFASSTAVTLLGSAGVPQQIDSDDAQAVELGLKFQSDVAGTVSGVRFYKSAANTGAHTGTLWSSTGTRLATVTFSNESKSGWQEASFGTPVTISANTQYVVSYHTTTGHYSDTQNGFKSSVSNVPLHALADGTSGPDGVYAYGAKALISLTVKSGASCSPAGRSSLNSEISSWLGVGLLLW